MAEKKAPETATDNPKPEIEISATETERMRAEAAQREHDRIEEIQNYGRSLNVHALAEEHIRKGTDIATFRGVLLENLPKDTPISSSTDLGLSRRERRDFSVVRAIRALNDKDPNVAKHREAAAFEIEVSRAYGEKVGKDARGIYIPLEVLHEKRALDTGSSSGGDHLVGTDHMGSEFIESLENEAAAFVLGARRLTGLEGEVKIPRRTAGASATWGAENAAATESDPTMDEVTLTAANELKYYTQLSRRLMLQSSPDVEALVRSDIFRAMGNGIDQAVINGSGASNVPQGVIGASGVGTQSLATLNYANVLEMEADLLAANAGQLGSPAWLGNSVGVRRCSATAKDAGSGMFLLDRAARVSGGNSMIKGSMLGYDFGHSENVPGDLAPGTASALILGVWSEILVGMWGGLDITTDPYTQSLSGQTRIIVFQTADVAIRLPQAFCVATDLAVS